VRMSRRRRPEDLQGAGLTGAGLSVPVAALYRSDLALIGQPAGRTHEAHRVSGGETWCKTWVASPSSLRRPIRFPPRENRTSNRLNGPRLRAEGVSITKGQTRVTIGQKRRLWMRPAVRAARTRLSRADLEVVLGIVRLAYEGIAQREAWAEMLRQARQLFRAHDVFLVRKPLEQNTTPLMMTTGVDPTLQTNYSARFLVPLTNPSIAAAVDLCLEGTVISSDLVPWQQVEKTDYFDAIRRPRGVRWEIGGICTTATDSRRHLTFNRLASSARFTSREEALMDQLWPHVDRVLKLQDQAAQREAEFQLLSGALDTDPDAILFLQPDGRVRALNSHGMDLLSENGRRPREARSLEEVHEPLRAALRETFVFLSRLGDSTRPPTTPPPDRLVRLSDSSAFRIRGEVRFENGTAKGVLVRCQRRDAESTVPEVNFAEWGFTSREQEVARALLAGSSSENICRSLGISRDTVKTHLRHLYQKTEAQSRTQLVTQLFRGRSV
jgi:DNA-binding CsgD family transcriptional regulator